MKRIAGDKQSILYEKRGRISYVTINRPQVLNAVDLPTKAKLVEAFRTFKADDEAWAMILTGAGDRAFCSGADMKYWRGHEEERIRLGGARDLYDRTSALGIAMLPGEIWKPIIAAVNGYCLGGGLEIALGCDIILAAEHASFGLPEVIHGWPPISGGVQRLARKIPRNLAMEMLLTGDRISAQDAYRIGLVNRVVPLADLLATATKLAKRINENPPLAVRAVKELTLRGLDMPLDYPASAWHLNLDSPGTLARDSEDAREGRRAFVEKRKPVFKGR